MHDERSAVYPGKVILEIPGRNPGRMRNRRNAPRRSWVVVCLFARGMGGGFRVDTKDRAHLDISKAPTEDKG